MRRRLNFVGDSVRLGCFFGSVVLICIFLAVSQLNSIELLYELFALLSYACKMEIWFAPRPHLILTFQVVCFLSFFLFSIYLLCYKIELSMLGLQCFCLLVLVTSKQFFQPIWSEIFSCQNCIFPLLFILPTPYC